MLVGADESTADVATEATCPAHYAVMERGNHPLQRRYAHRTEEHGTHPALIAIAAVIILAVIVVVFLLLQKPKQVTPVAVLGTSPSASSAATPTAVPVTVAPTAAPTTVSTTPGFASFNAQHTIVCKASDGGVEYPVMSWSVVNATGITISVDSPDGVFASYGTSGTTGPNSNMVPFACSTTPLQHKYYFTTTGGTGPAVTKEVTITGTTSSG
jgi:hypothetical protein